MIRVTIFRGWKLLLADDVLLSEIKLCLFGGENVFFLCEAVESVVFFSRGVRIVILLLF